MASRRQTAVPQQQRVGKGKNMAVADASNRRALEDIGNMVNARVKEGKPEVQINRHTTRSIGTPLLVNAQAAAEAAAAKTRDTAVDRGGAKLPKKVTVKSKNEKIDEEVIALSSEENQYTVAKSYRRRNSGKKITTLTSVLTARSTMSRELVDIDAADIGDPLAVVDYVEDIYKYYKSAENFSRLQDYMDSQVELNVKMRAILADWLIEVHHKFKLMPETLYLTFNIVDRYLSLETVSRRELQLVGVSAMLIASKYEEIWAPEVNDFICLSHRAYTREQILMMEKAILHKLKWSLTMPTAYVFLVRFVKAAVCNTEEEHMVFFFAELTLMQYSMLKYCPSMMASAAVYAARCTLKMSPLWTETLKYHTGFSKQELLDCTDILVNAHAAAPQGMPKSIFNRYSGKKFAGVALHPPATKLMEELKASRSSNKSASEKTISDFSSSMISTLHQPATKIMEELKAP